MKIKQENNLYNDNLIIEKYFQIEEFLNNFQNFPGEKTENYKFYNQFEKYVLKENNLFPAYLRRIFKLKYENIIYNYK